MAANFNFITGEITVENTVSSHLNISPCSFIAKAIPTAGNFINFCYNGPPPPPEPEDGDVTGLTLLPGLYKRKYEGYFNDQDSFFNDRFIDELSLMDEGSAFQITAVGTYQTQNSWTEASFFPEPAYDKPEALGLPFPSVGKGVLYVGGTPVEDNGGAKVGPRTVSEEVTSQIDDYYYQSQGGNNKSLIIKGYFKPALTGVYGFRLFSDDASYLWFGTAAYDGNRTMSNYVVGLPGVHGPYPLDGTFSMTANNYYPLTVEFGNSAYGEGVLIFSYLPPGSTEWTSDLTGKLFYEVTSKGHVNPA